MKLARIEYNGVVCEATVTCNGYLIHSPQEMAGAEVSEDGIRLLPPVAPGKILGWGSTSASTSWRWWPGRARAGSQARR